MIRHLLSVLSLILLAWSSLWACGAPLATAPTAVVNPVPALAAHEGQAGIHLAVAPDYYEERGCEGRPLGCYIAPEIDAHYLHHFNSRLSLGGELSYGGSGQAIGVGGRFRGWWIDGERVRWGGEVGWGWLYLDVKTPVAVKLAEPLWLWTAPAFQVQSASGFVATVPLGVTVRFNDHVALDVQAGAQLDVLGYTSETVGWQGAMGVDARF